MSWAAEEFATVDLGDKRLNNRLVKMAQQWADKPSQSIPTAASAETSTKACAGSKATSGWPSARPSCRTRAWCRWATARATCWR